MPCGAFAGSGRRHFGHSDTVDWLVADMLPVLFSKTFPARSYARFVTGPDVSRGDGAQQMTDFILDVSRHADGVLDLLPENFAIPLAKAMHHAFGGDD